MKYLYPGLCAAVAVTLFTLPATAQDVQEVLVVQLQEVRVTMAQEGFLAYGDPFYSRLNPGEVESLEVELEAGRNYLIVGVCDYDCSDLDLELRDGNGNVVSVDVEVDDVPIVDVTVTRSGTFYLRARMFDCDAAWCGYGVGIFVAR